MSDAPEIRIDAVIGLPEIGPGDDLTAMISACRDPRLGEIYVISQKVVSKAEGRLVALEEVSPGTRAREIAGRLEKDPRVVELILGESRAVLRAERGVLITETHHGLICANAGIDASNLAERETVALLPADPDASARQIRAGLASKISADPDAPVRQTGAAAVTDTDRVAAPAVVISDSFGRPWRLGQAEVAIGCAGLVPLDDWRGRTDTSGRELAATLIATADQVAAAADLARNKTSRTPVVVISGLADLITAEDGPGAAALRRPEPEDLFR